MLSTLSETQLHACAFCYKPADFDDGNDTAVPGTRWTNVAAVSTGNICGDVSIFFLKTTNLNNGYLWERPTSTQKHKLGENAFLVQTYLGFQSFLIYSTVYV